MKVYLYNKDTLIYEGERDARLDILASKYEQKDVYFKPENATFTELPELEEGQVAKYDINNDGWTIIESNVGKYLVNTNENYITKILEDKLIRPYELVITEEQYKDLMKNPEKYEIKENELIDISGTQEYQNRINIENYENLILAEKGKYDTFLNTPVRYKNSQYLPRYLDDYEKLQFRAFPQEIWDCTGLSSEVMSKPEFIALKSYLEGLVNKAYKEKKENIKKYKLAIEKLRG